MGEVSPSLHSPNRLSAWFGLFRYPLSWGLRPQTPVMLVDRVTFGIAELFIKALAANDNFDYHSMSQL